jgi:hypothetical protein
LRIEIKNWREFNPRSDVKKPSWFRLSHDLFEDPDFYDFSPNEMLAWIYILCHASKKNSETITVSILHLERVGRIKEKDFRSAVRKLELLQCITVPDTHTLRDRHVSDTPTNATNERTNETRRDEHADLPPQARPVLDFESLYQKYPRKEGKQKGVQACKAQIHTPEDFNALSAAIDRYREKIRREGTEQKYIKHFSSFMASWRDWLEPDAGTSPERKSLAQQWLEDNGGVA